MWNYPVTKEERNHILKELRLKIKDNNKCKYHCDICNAWKIEAIELNKNGKMDIMY